MNLPHPFRARAERAAHEADQLLQWVQQIRSVDLSDDVAELRTQSKVDQEIQAWARTWVLLRAIAQATPGGTA